MNEVKNNTSNTKKQFYKKWWFYLIVLVVIIALFSQGEENIDISKNNDIEQEQSSAKQTEEECTNAEFDKKIYEFDDTIDSFLKKYNEIYSDKITSEMVSKYYHHGREHDDQIKVLNEDFEITISSTYVNGANKGISVFIDNIKNLSNEEFKNIYKHYTKVYNENFSDEKLEEYWNELAGTSYSSLEEYDDIEFYLVYGTHDIVDYIKITGEIQ